MEKKTEYTASTLRICIDEMKTSENDIKGRICGIAVKDQEFFSGSSELFLLVDRLLDEIGKPQSSRKSRSFREEGNQITPYNYKPCLYHTSEEVQEEEGKILTRDVTFTSRLRSSWQGIMKDEKNNFIGKFESDLEFIGLLYDHGVTEKDYNENQRS